MPSLSKLEGRSCNMEGLDDDPARVNCQLRVTTLWAPFLPNTLSHFMSFFPSRLRLWGNTTGSIQDL